MILLECRWLVGVSYNIITYRDPIPSFERVKHLHHSSQLAALPGAIYLWHGLMTADAPSMRSLPLKF